MAEETAHPAVVGVVGGEDAVFAAEGDGVFREARVAGPGAEDVFPCLGGGEREFAGGDSDDVAVVGVVEAS